MEGKEEQEESYPLGFLKRQRKEEGSHYYFQNSNMKYANIGDNQRNYYNNNKEEDVEESTNSGKNCCSVYFIH